MNETFSQQEHRPLAQLLHFSLPAIMGMLLTSGIILVDGLFIGRVIGQEGLASVNLSLPVLYLFLGISIMIAMGGAVKAGYSLGANESDKAKAYFTLSVLLALALIVPLALILRVTLGPLSQLLAGKMGQTQWLSPYLGTILWFYPAMMLNILFSTFLRTEGKPMHSLFFGIAGNLLNLVLDYLFIVRWSMGMRGAALASGISVLIPLGLGLIFFCSSKSRLGFHSISSVKKQVGEIFFNGSSEMIGQLSVALTMAIFNRILLSRLGLEGVATYTIVGYICFIQVMFITGLCEGLSPIVSYSRGAGKWMHIRKITKTALYLVFGIGVLCWLGTLLGGPAIAGLFSRGNPQVIDLAKKGFWLFTLAFLFNGFNFIASAYFTSMGNPKNSAAIASLRGLILINVFVLLLPLILGDWGIWLSLPLAEFLTLILAWMLLKKSMNRLNSGSMTEPALEKIRA